ncbi:MAG: hypothetical protein KJ737_15155 [Proteobacteria bacterium]|nr:hypothetical protein [Pseudomonadota bacterium]
MQRVPSDVVKVIFHFLGSDAEFEADIPKIHRVFFNMSKNIEGLDSLMKQFVFDESKPFPCSNTVSRAIDRLQKSNLLHCMNPRLDKFKVSTNLSLETEIKDLFTRDELETLKKGAAYFKSQFSIHNSKKTIH